MPQSHLGESQKFTLDILAQSPRLNRLYTQVTFFFSLHDAETNPSSQEEKIINTLKTATRTLFVHFPWIAGTVVNDNGVFKIEIRHTPDSERESHENPLTSRLMIKDYWVRNNKNSQEHPFPSYKTLQESNFPSRYLAENLLAPVPTLVDLGAITSTSTYDLPVLLIQGIFIDGGFLLTFNAQHGAMDMAGFASVIGLFAKGCFGTLLELHPVYTDEEIKVGNMQRVGRLPLSPLPSHSLSSHPKPKEGTEGKKDEERTEPLPKAIPSSSGPKPDSEQELVWSYFSFSPSSLATLKSQAMQSLPLEVGAETEAKKSGLYVSTDDALSAFIWKSLTLARLPPSSNPRDTISTSLSRNVDVRQHLSTPLPTTYPGFMTTSTSHTSPAPALLSSSLGSITLSLRKALQPRLLREKAISQALSIQQQQSQPQPQPPAQPPAQPAIRPPQINLEVRLSSWSKESALHNLSFGPGLGKPDAVRRPAFTDGAREGLVYFLPRGIDGSVVVGVCLNNGDMRVLRGILCDGETGGVEYIG